MKKLIKNIRDYFKMFKKVKTTKYFKEVRI
jgi:hypothetical protein